MTAFVRDGIRSAWRAAMVVAAASLLAACGDRSALLVDVDVSTGRDATTPPGDAGTDAITDAPDGTPVDAPPDTPDSEPPSDASILCAWRAVGATGISDVDCPAGSACVPTLGCVATPDQPTTPCGGVACANACGCVTASACNCADMP